MANDIIRIRRDTYLNWTSSGTVLGIGEISYDTNNKQIRVGDGTTNWIDLTPIGASAVSAPIDATYIVQTATAGLSQEQSLGALTTGLLKNTVTGTTGVLTTAVAADLPAHNHAASEIISGILTVARLGSGTPTSLTVLLGDGSWGSIPAHVHSAADITSGTMATARLGTGTASSSTVLLGSQAYSTLGVNFLSDVTITGLANLDLLQYESATGQWTNQTIAYCNLAPAAAKYIVQQVTTGLTAEQSLGALTTGIVKNTVTGTTGELSIAGGSDLPTHTHALSNLVTTGTAGSTNFLRGDGAWTTGILVSAGVVTTTDLGGDITTAGKALLDDADASAQRTTLGLRAMATQALTSTDGSVAISAAGGNTDLSVTVAGSTTNVLCQVRNTTGTTLTKGTAVYISGVTGQIPTVTKAIANSDPASAQTLGLMSADLADNTNGYVTIIGLITNIDTTAFSNGQQLYLSPSTLGGLTDTKPVAPNHLVYVAVVEYAHLTQGKLFVKVQNGYELNEIHDALITSPATGQVLTYDSSSSLWKNQAPANAPAGTLTGTTLAAGVTASSLTSVGTLADLTVTAPIAGSVTGNAATVTTNANLTGHITSSGNVTILGSFTSANLATALSTKTGTGLAVFDTSPTLVTPTIGAATATTINKVAITAPATGSTLTIADGRTLTCNSNLTFSHNASAINICAVNFGNGTSINVAGLASPTFTGNVTSPAFNKVAITAPATGSTLTVADGKVLTASNTLTFTGTDSSSVEFGAGGTVVYTSDLGTGMATFLAAPSSANLISAITDETGTGALIFANSPTLVSPALGTPTSGVLTNCTGTAAGLTAGAVTPAGSNTQVQYNNAGTSAGATNIVVDSNNLRLLDTSITSATAAGGATLFSKKIGLFHLPSWNDERGVWRNAQVCVGRNRVGFWGGNNNVATAPTASNVPIPTAIGGTLTARNMAATSVLAATRKVGIVSAATSASITGWRTTSSMGVFSSTARIGGGQVICRFAISDPALVTSGARTFIGINYASSNYAAGTEVDTLLNQVGFAQLTGAANPNNLYILSNDGTGTATKSDTGYTITNTDLLEATFQWIPGSSTLVGYRLDNLTSGTTIVEGTLTTDLPVNNTLLHFHMWRTNGSFPAAVGLDMAQVYFETYT